MAWSSNHFIILPTALPGKRVSNLHDLDSIMHYSGGSGGSKTLLGLGHRKTVLGSRAKPDESLKKNMKPSELDVARVHDMYADDPDCDPQSGRVGEFLTAAPGGGDDSGENDD